MSVVIRLTKTGKGGERKFRIVVKEKRSKRDGKAVEFLGWYEKSTTQVNKKINHERINYWVKQGAQISTGLKKIIEA